MSRPGNVAMSRLSSVASSLRTPTGIAYLVSLLFVVVGALVLAGAGSTEVSSSFGWFAYAPTSGETYQPQTDSVLLLRTAHVVGLSSVVMGLLIAVATTAFGVGLGRRPAREAA